MNINSSISIESMLDGLFTNRRDVYGLEDDVVDEITGAGDTPAEVEENQVTAVTEPEDQAVVDEVVNTPPEEVDETAIAETAEQYAGEAMLLTLALKTAEEFIWSRATEAEGDNIFKKFWDWIKKIVEKIRMFILTGFKRLQVWLAGDMKNISKWAADNKSKLTPEILKTDVKIKLKLPITKINDYESQFQKSLAIVHKETVEATTAISAGEGNPALTEQLKDDVAKVTVKSFADTLYGAKAVANEVGIAAFNEKYPIVSNITAEGIAKVKLAMSLLQVGIKNANEQIRNAVKNSSKAGTASANDIKELKELAAASFKALNTVSSSTYWFAVQNITLVNYAFRFAKAGVGKVAGIVAGAGATSAAPAPIT